MMILASLLSFLLGVYLTAMFVIFFLGSSDPEGRFKLRYAFLWPFYLKKIFSGNLD